MAILGFLLFYFAFVQYEESIAAGKLKKEPDVSYFMMKL